ncbi:MAG: hypothetical protein ACRETQ_02090 [Gammaproteobacteria bacterium]
MNTDEFLAGFRQSPDFLLHDFDFQHSRGLIVSISQDAYRTASFLDHRLFTPETVGVWFPLETLTGAITGMTAGKTPCCIFQVGHCGSTLVSRLLAELPDNLPIREPRALLALAVIRRDQDRPSSWVNAAQWQRYYDLAMHALGRTYVPDTRALIKLTSTAGNLLEPMTAGARPMPQALLLYINLEAFLAVMLRTPDMRDSLHADSPGWVTDFCRLTGRTDIRLSELDDAQQAVIKWLVLMLIFSRALAACPAQTHLLDFEAFLKNPAAELTTIAKHFQLRTELDHVERLVNSPLMRSYSKIPAQPFTGAQRELELRAARAQFHDEIQSGLRWAETLSRNTPALDAAAAYLSHDPAFIAG